MIDLAIETNLDAFNDALTRYAGESGMTSKEALRQQGRLLLVRMIALTPPRSQKQGRDAIRKDLDASIPLKSAKDFESEHIRTLIREGRYDALNEIMRASGSPLRFSPFDKSRHIEARGRRKRVDRRKDYRDNATTEAAPRAKFLRQLQSGVGRAKGGWAHALIKLGGKPARWIARHAEAGEFYESPNNSLDPFLLFVNQSGWAGSRSGNDAPDAVMRAAMRSRARNIAQDLARRQARALQAQLGRASRTGRKAVVR
jgi:hypothetical protein